MENQPIDLQSNSMDWFLYERDLHYYRVKVDKEGSMGHSVKFVQS